MYSRYRICGKCQTRVKNQVGRNRGEGNPRLPNEVTQGNVHIFIQKGKPAARVGMRSVLSPSDILVTRNGSCSEKYKV